MQHACSPTNDGRCVTLILYGLRLDESKMILNGSMKVCDACKAEAQRMLDRDAKFQFDVV